MRNPSLIPAIECITIDKISGNVAYAVLSFGGFLGMGEDYYPVPWSKLDYETNLGGYRVNFTKDQLDQAPKYTESQGWNWSRENDRRVYDYYRADPYWQTNVINIVVSPIAGTSDKGASIRSDVANRLPTGQ